MSSIRHTKCPSCRKSGPWLEGSFLPFCSKRCQLVDLGKWFNQEHAISEPLKPSHFEKFEDLPPGKHLDAAEGES